MSFQRLACVIVTLSLFIYKVSNSSISLCRARVCPVSRLADTTDLTAEACYDSVLQPPQPHTQPASATAPLVTQSVYVNSTIPPKPASSTTPSGPNPAYVNLSVGTAAAPASLTTDSVYVNTGTTPLVADSIYVNTATGRGAQAGQAGNPGPAPLTTDSLYVNTNTSRPAAAKPSSATAATTTATPTVAAASRAPPVAPPRTTSLPAASRGAGLPDIISSHMYDVIDGPADKSGPKEQAALDYEQPLDSNSAYGVVTTV